MVAMTQKAIRIRELSEWEEGVFMISGFSESYVNQLQVWSIG